VLTYTEEGCEQINSGKAWLYGGNHCRKVYRIYIDMLIDHQMKTQVDLQSSKKPDQIKVEEDRMWILFNFVSLSEILLVDLRLINNSERLQLSLLFLSSAVCDCECCTASWMQAL
jgi:hypothetical protein